ncbi:hypothetical protein [Halomarina litorea]|uniref:hypothetical protein n=1 Tax=Halomarina litorea TaxID=2961595 RepID=UPI0020C5621D|nr:hypothetical protein [Halomarina sp. BCD28]
MDYSRSRWTGPRTVIAATGVVLLGVALGVLGAQGALTTTRLAMVTFAFAVVALAGSVAHRRLV